MTATVHRIVQVSDVHLGAAAGPEREQRSAAAWREFAEQIRARPPDLVVATGDLVVDDPDDRTDQELARRLLGDLGVPVMALPGNHDVGDHPVRDGLPADWLGLSVTPERVRAWESLWGPGYQVRECGEWLLIGLNAQLFGSGFPAEAEQWRWLSETALAMAMGRPSLVFMHESLAQRPEYDGDVPDSGWMSIPRGDSERLALALRAAGVRMVCAGHTHRFATWERDGLRGLTAPSLSGPIPVRRSMVQADGDPRPGWLELTLAGDDVTVRHVVRSSPSTEEHSDV